MWFYPLNNKHLCSVGPDDGNIKGILLLLLVVVFPISTLAQQYNHDKNSRMYRLDPMTENSVAPDFLLPDRHGIAHELSAYRGHVVVVNFWSTWCIPCRQEMPALESAWQQLQPSGVVLLSIAIKDEVEAIDRFLEKSPVSFVVLMDSDGKVSEQWRVIGIPVTYILDASGRIVYRATGVREWDSEQVVNKIRDLADVTTPKSN